MTARGIGAAVIVAGIVAAVAAHYSGRSDGDSMVYASVLSDTDWSGSFGNRSVDGHGNQRVELPSNVTCVVAQKQTREGFLQVHIHSRGIDFEAVQTTAEFGVVSTCGAR